MSRQPEPEWTLPTLKALQDERFAAMDKALTLQAAEYHRRLDALNHAHEKAIEVQHTYVTSDKYEDKLAAEATARDVALTRIDEKFEDYVQRYELRQREVDQALTLMEGAAAEAKRIADHQARRTNRNISVMGLALAVFIALANYASSH